MMLSEEQRYSIRCYKSMNDVVELAAGVVAVFLLFVFMLVVWYGPGYCAVRDAYKRGQGSAVIILLWLLVGPFSALIWLAIRPSKTLLETLPREFTSPDDALSAAARLDHGGEWVASARIYESVAERWPDHREYANRCLEAIRSKQPVA
jgi:hypothetical protein